MEELIQEVSNMSQGMEALRESCRVNSVDIKVLKGLSFQKVKQLYSSTKKNAKQNSKFCRTNWLQNQRKIFYWVLVVLSAIDKMLIKFFNQKHWDRLSQIFPNKELHVLEYDAFLLVKAKPSPKVWSSEQKQLFQKINNKYEEVRNWNEIAKLLYLQSGKKNIRIGKQCRQFWVNHLNPVVCRDPWTLTEDILFLELMLRHNKKWTLVSKDMNFKRTEHMLKNRLKSLENKFCSKEEESYPTRKKVKFLLKKLKLIQDGDIALKQTYEAKHRAYTKKKKEKKAVAEKICKRLLPKKTKTEQRLKFEENEIQDEENAYSSGEQFEEYEESQSVEEKLDELEEDQFINELQRKKQSHGKESEKKSYQILSKDEKDDAFIPEQNNSGVPRWQMPYPPPPPMYYPPWVPYPPYDRPYQHEQPMPWGPPPPINKAPPYPYPYHHPPPPYY